MKEILEIPLTQCDVFHKKRGRYFVGVVDERPTPFSTPFFPLYPRQIIDNGTPTVHFCTAQVLHTVRRCTRNAHVWHFGTMRPDPGTFLVSRHPQNVRKFLTRFSNREKLISPHKIAHLSCG